MAAVGIGFMWHRAKSRSTNRLLSTLNQINLNLKDADRAEKDFFGFETINPAFFQSGESKYVSHHKQLIDKLNLDLRELFIAEELKDNAFVQRDIDSLQQTLNSYDRTFDSLVQLIHIRGFKDYGIEGVMRAHIHSIEHSQANLPLAEVLMLRRHEKDYILRKDLKYIAKMEAAVGVLQQSINRLPNEKQRRVLSETLKKYQTRFVELAKVEGKIGTNDRSGLKAKLMRLSEEIEFRIREINQRILREANEIKARLEQGIFTLIFVSLLLNILLGLLLYRALGRPVKQISTEVRRVVRSNFQKEYALNTSYNSSEFALIAKDIQRMVETVWRNEDELLRRNAQLEQYAEEVATQRDTLEEQNRLIKHERAEIAQQKEEIEAQRDQLDEQNKLMFEQTETLIEQGRKIKASINYASRIQHALLPSDWLFHDVFQDYFILYEPRDTVSGDFYWLDEVINADGKKMYIFAVADCTGHGVPGALMSAIGTHLLDKAVSLHRQVDPERILDTLHRNTIELLEQETNSSRDGMDVGLCVIDPKTNTLKFSGAHTPLLIVTKDKELKVYKGDRRSIGGVTKKNQAPFTPHTLQILPGDTCFLFSDGLQDQFGGPEGKKFMLRRLKETLTANAHLPARDQKRLLKQELQNWRGELPQVDDILVVGFQLRASNA